MLCGEEIFSTECLVRGTHRSLRLSFLLLRHDIILKNMVVSFLFLVSFMQFSIVSMLFHLFNASPTNSLVCLNYPHAITQSKPRYSSYHVLTFLLSQQNKRCQNQYLLNWKRISPITNKGLYFKLPQYLYYIALKLKPIFKINRCRHSLSIYRTYTKIWMFKSLSKVYVRIPVLMLKEVKYNHIALTLYWRVLHYIFRDCASQHMSWLSKL